MGTGSNLYMFGYMKCFGQINLYSLNFKLSYINLCLYCVIFLFSPRKTKLKDESLMFRILPSWLMLVQSWLGRLTGQNWLGRLTGQNLLSFNMYYSIYGHEEKLAEEINKGVGASSQEYSLETFHRRSRRLIIENSPNCGMGQGKYIALRRRHTKVKTEAREAA
ncbi:hypothetical protein Hdeb2414_s0382g00881591 [Helianthus debilis subsp. tardiflorus]